MGSKCRETWNGWKHQHRTENMAGLQFGEKKCFDCFRLDLNESRAVTQPLMSMSCQLTIDDLSHQLITDEPVSSADLCSACLSTISCVSLQWSTHTLTVLSLCHRSRGGLRRQCPQRHQPVHQPLAQPDTRPGAGNGLHQQGAVCGAMAQQEVLRWWAGRSHGASWFGMETIVACNDTIIGDWSHFFRSWKWKEKRETETRMTASVLK